MQFIEPTFETFNLYLSKIKADTTALWGSMNAIRMIEHLTDAVQLSIGEIPNIKLELPEDKVERAQGFLLSEHPMPKNFQASFAQADTPNRNSTVEEALTEFESNWQKFESHFEQNPNAKFMHPNFGELDVILWKRLHSKHFTHHFEQFGLI